MKEWLQRVQQRPGIAHLLRANTRYKGRLGKQFAGAITYFSVLAIVPILMFAFAIAGFILVEVVPAWKDQVTSMISAKLSALPKDLQQKIQGVVSNSLNHYAAIGIIGLLSAMYAGAKWIGNLKSAVRAQWRPAFDLTEDKHNIVVEVLLNFAILIGLLILVVVTFAIASVATALSSRIIGLLGLSSLPGIGFLSRLIPIVISLLVGWLLFMFLFLVLPQTAVPRRARAKGAVIAAVGLAVLQYLTGYLFGVFGGNAAASVFGPVIVLMLFFNLFAQLTLFCAAWVATTDQPALSAEEARRHDDEQSEPAEADGEGKPDTKRRPRRWGAGDPVAARAAATPVGGKVGWIPGGGQEQVPQSVAVRSVRLGMGAGYLTGTATGVGLGAVTAVVARRVAARRTRRSRR